MKESLLSVGIDLGTTTTQLVLSRLYVENRASAYSVPQMEIGEREILYRSRIHMTPLIGNDTIDAEAIRCIVAEEYERSGTRPQDVQTGAVIITGETARKENAKAVLRALSDYAGKFVVATAGPSLEGILAARGAGADRCAKTKRCHVLHIDIGGGTSNMALFDPAGELLGTGCLNVGVRLLKLSQDGTVTYCSPVLEGTSAPKCGEKTSPEALQPIIQMLVQVLEEGSGLRKPELLSKFVTDHILRLPDVPLTISLSGGVAELIRRPEENWLRYGDIGVLLADAIRKSGLCQGNFVLGNETLQATVIGAGTHTTELSGSTVSWHGIAFPLQDLPVVTLPWEAEQAAPEVLGAAIKERIRNTAGGTAALALRGIRSPSFAQVSRLADGICAGVRETVDPVVVVLREDMAKVLGQMLRTRLGAEIPLICLDNLKLQEGMYLDIGAPLKNGSAVPVVIKTLAFL